MKDIGQLFVNLSELGHKSQILTYSVKANRKLNRKNGVELVKVNSFIKKENWLLSPMNIVHIHFLRYILRHRKNIHCIFSVFNNTMLIPLFYKLSNRKGIAVIKMDSDGRLYNGKLRLIKRIIGTCLFSILNNKIDLFIIETPEGKEQLLLRHPELRDKLMLIPNGINIKQLSNLSKEITKEKKFRREESKTILFVGDVIPRKGTDLLVKAFGSIASNYPEWKVKIVGRLVDSTYERYLHELILGMDLISKVIFTGRISLKELVLNYMNAEIFCFPSRHESFGLVIIEAMYFGKPVISSDVGVAKYALENGSGFIFRTGNINELTRLLEAFMSNEQLREEIGKKAERRCKLLFDYEKIAKTVDYILSSDFIARKPKSICLEFKCKRDML